MREIKTSYTLPKRLEPDERFKDKTIVYQHIGATGGRTFSQTLAQYYPKENSFRPDGNEFIENYKDFLALPADEKQKLKYICGHHSFGVHTALEQKCEYVTIVRNPIQRFISHHNYNCFNIARGIGPKHLLERGRYFTLEESVNKQLKKRSHPYGEGYLVEFLCGDMKPWNDNTAPDNEPNMSKDEKTALILETAERYFPFIGITELMDESLFVLACKLGWSHIPFWHRRSSAKDYTFEIEEPTEAVMRKIMHLNEISIALYEIFTKRFLKEFDGLKARCPEVEDWIQEYQEQRASNIPSANL